MKTVCNTFSHVFTLYLNIAPFNVCSTNVELLVSNYNQNDREVVNSRLDRACVRYVLLSKGGNSNVLLDELLNVSTRLQHRCAILS